MGQREEFNKQTLLSSSLSTTPSSHYNVVFYGDSSLPEASPLNSSRKLVGRQKEKKIFEFSVS